MKDVGRVSIPAGSASFISHMVQMKVVTLLNKLVLNPTFISHMVQMKEIAKLMTSLEERLYIPHGSDESKFSFQL